MVSHNFHKTWFILLISFILLVVFIVTYPACFANTEKNIEEKRIITLDNALFLQMKNDVAFLINTTEMCLIEHSSTVCLNYPLRSLLYLAREYEVILEQRNENILKYGLVKIPIFFSVFSEIAVLLFFIVIGIPEVCWMEFFKNIFYAVHVIHVWVS